MWNIIVSIIAAFFKGLLSKAREEKLQDQITQEKDQVIQKVKDAKKIRLRLVTDADYANRVRDKYERKD